MTFRSPAPQAGAAPLRHERMLLNGDPPRIRTETLAGSEPASSTSWDREPLPARQDSDVGAHLSLVRFRMFCRICTGRCSCLIVPANRDRRLCCLSTGPRWRRWRGSNSPAGFPTHLHSKQRGPPRPLHLQGWRVPAPPGGEEPALRVSCEFTTVVRSEGLAPSRPSRGHRVLSPACLHSDHERVNGAGCGGRTRAETKLLGF